MNRKKFLRLPESGNLLHGQSPSIEADYQDMSHSYLLEDSLVLSVESDIKPPLLFRLLSSLVACRSAPSPALTTANLARAVRKQQWAVLAGPTRAVAQIIGQHANGFEHGQQDYAPQRQGSGNSRRQRPSKDREDSEEEERMAKVGDEAEIEEEVAALLEVWAGGSPAPPCLDPAPAPRPRAWAPSSPVTVDLISFLSMCKIFAQLAISSS